VKRPAAHPATISPLTQSLTIAINAGTPATFNTTPASPGCMQGTAGTTCTFAIDAPAGTDTFAVTTYSAASGGGTALDRGVVTVPIVKGKANQVAITLGPVVTTAADSGMGSLRYAVGSASKGDTIMFLLPAGSTIALATPITIVGNVDIAGPGSSSLTISGGGTHQIFIVTGTATISGLTLTHGSAAVPNQPGGAIYNIGSLTLANDVIGNSTSTVSLRRAPRRHHDPRLFAHRMHPHCTTTYSEGGALYNNGAATISATTFSGNVVISNAASCITAEGGAIYNDTLGSLTSTGDTYTNNSAAAGGAVYNAGYGLVTFTNDTFDANTGCTASSGCLTSGCNATSCTSFAVGQGAAIDDNGVGITVVNSAFTNNVAGGATPASVGEGGAIYLDVNSILPTISGSTFAGNLAGGGTSSCSMGDGGAILANNPIELDNDTFQNNSASGDNNSAGGAVAGGLDVTGTGDTFSGNTVSTAGGACTTSGTAGGGAAYSGSGNVTFNNSTFTNNSATANYIAAGGALGAGNNVTVNNSTFTSNTATSSGTYGASNGVAGGGAVLATAIAKANGSTFTSNLATAGGPGASGALAGALGGANILSMNNSYTSNSAAAPAGGTVTATGGAVSSTGGTLLSTNDTFSGNSATGVGISAGGAGYLDSGTCALTNVKASSNTASGASGVGGAFTFGGTCKLTNVTLTANAAIATNAAKLGGGGGIYDVGGATIFNSTISGNTATNAGGGIASDTSPTTIESSTVSGNAVTSASLTNTGGGGIADSAGVALNEVTIADNTVTASGSGPAGGGGIFDSGGIVMIYSTISANKMQGNAADSGGGGIFTSSGGIGLDDTISDNASATGGGGLDLDASAVATFSNVTIYHNVATTNGGNVIIGSSATLSLANSILAAGAAANGDDAYNGGTLHSGDYNIIQTAPGGNAIGGTTTHDLAVDPKLLSLTNNGGPTLTRADQAPGVSPGTQYVPFSGGNCGSASISVDQRGFARGAGGHCDVGAYEYAGVATAVRHRHTLPKAHFRRDAPARLTKPHVKPPALSRLLEQ
jgi:hypothetical protein